MNAKEIAKGLLICFFVVLAIYIITGSTDDLANSAIIFLSAYFSILYNVNKKNNNK